MSRFTDALFVSPLVDGKTWAVLRSFGYGVDEADSGVWVDIAVRLTMDFASISRGLWMVLPSWGKYGNSAIILDWHYWVRSRSRKSADEIIFKAMGVLSVPLFRMRHHL